MRTTYRLEVALAVAAVLGWSGVVLAEQVVYLNFGSLTEKQNKDDKNTYQQDRDANDNLVVLSTLKKDGRLGLQPTDLGFKNNDDRDAIIQKIKAAVEANYEGLNITFTKEEPDSGTFTTINIISGSFPSRSLGDGKYQVDLELNRITITSGALEGYYIDRDDGQLYDPDGNAVEGSIFRGMIGSSDDADNTLGLAQQIDKNNANANHGAWIFAGNFDKSDDAEKNQQQMVNTISHELAHLLGLEHGDGEAGSIMGPTTHGEGGNYGDDKDFSDDAQEKLEATLPAKTEEPPPRQQSDKEGDTDQHGTSKPDEDTGDPDEDAAQKLKEARRSQETHHSEHPQPTKLDDIRQTDPVDGLFTDVPLKNGTVATYSLTFGEGGLIPEFLGAWVELELLNVADVLGDEADLRVFLDGQEMIGALDGLDQRIMGDPDFEGYALSQRVTLFLDQFFPLDVIAGMLADGHLLLELHVNGATPFISVDSVLGFFADRGAGTGCGPCPTDVDGSGSTGAFDLAFLLGNWGPVTPASECLDADGDGFIAAFDLAVLLGGWGPCPAPPDCIDNEDCGDGNPCTLDICNVDDGTCSNPPSPDGTPCDDDNACTTGDACEAGQCAGGEPPICDDGNECTDDACEPDVGCVSTPAPEGTACDDGNACTTADACEGGQCTGGEPPICDDGNQCTDDDCDPDVGCVSTPSPAGTACGNPSDTECTDPDTCDGIGNCDPRHAPIATPCGDPSDTECDDPDTCDNDGNCQANGAPDGTNCEDGDNCTDNDICLGGTCSGLPVDCPKGQECVEGECVGGGILDYLTTCPDAQNSSVNFGSPEIPPIPADFFEPGSDPFVGNVCLQGHPPTPIQPGNTDTIVERSSDPLGGDAPVGSVGTVSIEIVEMSLISCEPITVTFNGGQNPEQWLMTLGLSVVIPPLGSLTVTKTHCNGGTFDSNFNVQHRFTFTKVDDPDTVRVFDTGLEGIPPVELLTAGGSWVHEPDPNIPFIPCDPACEFAPGIEEIPPCVPNSQQHLAPFPANSAGGGVRHCVLPAQPIPQCGNGILEEGEECDPPGSPCPDKQQCQDNCTCPPPAGGPINNNCVDRLAIFNGSTDYSTIGATTDGLPHDVCQFDGQTYQDIWFNYDATCSGNLIVTTCNQADYDTDLVVYDGCWPNIPCPPDDTFLLGCNDDYPNCVGFTSTVVVPVVAGNCYKIRVGGWNPGNEGTGTLTVTCGG